MIFKNCKRRVHLYTFIATNLKTDTKSMTPLKKVDDQNWLKKRYQISIHMSQVRTQKSCQVFHTKGI